MAVEQQAKPGQRSCHVSLVLSVLLVVVTSSGVDGMSHNERAKMRERVRSMFYHAYDNYMTHAFPHDELKPLTQTFTDSLAELGNLKLEHLSDSYRGSALTLVDALSTLAVLGNYSEFRRVTQWLGNNLSFDTDVRVNVFEVTIRMLGGLVSGHLLALQEPIASATPPHPACRQGPPVPPSNPPASTPLSGAAPEAVHNAGRSCGEHREADTETVIEAEGGGGGGRPHSWRGVCAAAESLGVGAGVGVCQVAPPPWQMAFAFAGTEGAPACRPGNKGKGNCTATGVGEMLLGGAGERGQEGGNLGREGEACKGDRGVGSGEGVCGERSVGSEGGGRWYRGELLDLARDLGDRLMRAFNTPTRIPYAWVNLRHGVRHRETTETSTSVAGTLLLEFGLLSRLTGNASYEAAARTALHRVWAMRSPLDLVGTTLDVATGQWLEISSGIGAGVDSFYEYLLKAYILLGDTDAWGMFHAAYSAAQRHYRVAAPLSWYQDANMMTGRPTYRMFCSLQAFWPALQVLAGDVAAANETHRQFYSVWQKYGMLPERYLYDLGVVHPTQKHYPLRPELAESTYALYHATKDPWYLEVGRQMVLDLEKGARVPGGYSSVKDVETGEHEDHMHSFFLSEMCKYLYMLYDDGALERLGIHNFVFSTEGHILPVWPHLHQDSFEYPGLGEGGEGSPGAGAPRRRPREGQEGRKEQEGQGTKAFSRIGLSATERWRRRALGNHRASPLQKMVCPNPHLDWEEDKETRRRQRTQQVGEAREGSEVGTGEGGLALGAATWAVKPESVCHVLDKREDHRCVSDVDCGVEASSCRRRTCSPASFCATWMQ